MEKLFQIMRVGSIICVLLWLFPPTALGQRAEIIELLNSGMIQFEQQNFDSAITLEIRAISLAEKSLKSDDTLLEKSIKQLGYHYVTVAAYPEAARLIIKTLALVSQRLGDKHPTVATLRHAVGNIYWWNGDFSEAEKYHRLALALREELFGQDHWLATANLHNLANIAKDRGDFAEAERMEHRVLANRKKSLEPGNRELAKSYNLLGELAYIRGDYDEALDLLYQSLEILRLTLGEMTQPYVDCLKRIGIAHRERQDFDTARVILNNAINRSRIVYGGPHHRISDILQELALLSKSEKMTDSAIAQFIEAIKIREVSSASHLSEQAICYENLSRLYFGLGDLDLASETASQAVNIRMRNFFQNGDILPERQALIYSTYLRRSVNNYLHIVVAQESPPLEYQLHLADLILETKGLVTDVIAERRIGQEDNDDATVQKLKLTLKRLRRQSSRLFVKGPEENIDQYNKEIDSLLALSNETEAELLRKNRGHNKLVRHRKISSQTIKQVIPVGSALIEYYRSHGEPGDFDVDNDRYIAVFLSPKSKTRVIDLGQANAIDSLINTYREHMQALTLSGGMIEKSDINSYKVIADELYRKIWLPTEKYINPSSDVYLSPDGDLNLLSFAGLTKPDGSYLIESITMHYLTSARDLIQSEIEQPITSGLLAVGDPDFNSILPLVNAKDTPGTSTNYSRAFRGFSSPCSNLSDMVVSALPSTRFEVERVAEFWDSEVGDKTVLLFGKQANESKFKKYSPGSRVIYLATHGYFFKDTCYNSGNEGQFKYGNEISVVNPLLRSGLFLAGANLMDSEVIGSRTEDGVLTALEVSDLDLRGTELVVLSACETGLGKVQSGEGVYGIRKAFQMAGAHKIISSLWAVSDQSTGNMMSHLFKHSDESLATRLRTTQLVRLGQLREQHKLDHPFDWAAFIVLEK